MRPVSYAPPKRQTLYRGGAFGQRVTREERGNSCAGGAPANAKDRDARAEPSLWDSSCSVSSVRRERSTCRVASFARSTRRPPDVKRWGWRRPGLERFDETFTAARYRAIEGARAKPSATHL